MAEWTFDQIEKLRRLWGEGLSATMMIKYFDYVFTRSAILGKVNRLGLKSRRDGLVRQEHHKPRPREMPRFVKNTDSKPLPPPSPPEEIIVPIKAKRKRTCLATEFDDDKFFSDWVLDLAPRKRAIYSIPKDKHCKFIIGEVASFSSYWCNKPTTTGSWCPYHHKLVYQPPGTYRRNKK